MLNKRSAILLSAAIGMALELAIHAMSGRREAWDSGEYWTVGLPVALVLSLVIGLLTRDRDWLWTALVVPSQVLTMIVRNGALGVERLIGSARRECFDHVIVFNEAGLQRLMTLSCSYSEWSRTHLSLDKDTPIPRPISPPGDGTIVAIPQVGLHHRYERRAA